MEEKLTHAAGRPGGFRYGAKNGVEMERKNSAWWCKKTRRGSVRHQHLGPSGTTLDCS